MKNLSRWAYFFIIFIFVSAVNTSASIETFFFGKKENKLLGNAKRGDLIQRVTIAGTVVPKRKTVINPPYSGYVKKIFVKVGDIVKKGDPIISVTQSLQSSDPVFPLRAPMPGTVVQISKTEGEYVKEGDQSDMVRIDDLSEIYISANVAEIDVPKLKLNQETQISISAILGSAYPGVITEISQAALERKGWNQQQVEFPVRVAVTRPDLKLKPGMSAVVDVITGIRKNVLMLKHEFVRKKDGKYFVELEDGSHRNIQVGLRNEEYFEIKSGLKSGEKVSQIDFLSLDKI